MNSNLTSTTKARLKFIDLARSIAILLMIEGHFTGAALNAEYRDTSHIPFYIWKLIHGITAPMFFTVTGLIFVYLLLGNEQLQFWKNPRVKKGFRRVGTLLFWGYFIQLNFRSIYFWLKGEKTLQFSAFLGFHVLQSIAMCIFTILVVYGLYRLVKKGKAYVYFILGAGVMLVLSSILKAYVDIDEDAIAAGLKTDASYWPPFMPSVIQNMFYGPISAFSFVNTSVYALAGGAFGALLRLHGSKVMEYKFILKTIFGGIALLFISIPVLFSIDWLLLRANIIQHDTLLYNIALMVRLGEVISVIGILMLIEKRFGLRDSLFLKVGQHTLPIYVIHAIILYGGIFGFGLKPRLFNRDMEPLFAILVSISALAAAFLFVKYIEVLERFYNRFILFRRESKS